LVDERAEQFGIAGHGNDFSSFRRQRTSDCPAKTARGGRNERAPSVDFEIHDASKSNVHGEEVSVMLRAFAWLKTTVPCRTRF
jgi:hypothetical protein